MDFQSSFHFSRRTRSWASILAALFAALWVGIAAVRAEEAVAQTNPESGATESETTSVDFIDEDDFKRFLTDSIGWYRRLLGAGAWVSAPDDVRYFDEARDLARPVLSKASKIDDDLTRALINAVKHSPGLRLLGDSGRALIVKQPEAT